MIWGFMAHYKYLIVVVAGLLIVGVLDDNSFRRRIEYSLQISALQEEIDKYNRQHAADAKELELLKRDPHAIEKIAREHYFMKADDEDIFVLSDDDTPKEPSSENETAQ